MLTQGQIPMGTHSLREYSGLWSQHGLGHWRSGFGFQRWLVLAVGPLQRSLCSGESRTGQDKGIPRTLAGAGDERERGTQRCCTAAGTEALGTVYRGQEARQEGQAPGVRQGSLSARSTCPDAPGLRHHRLPRRPSENLGSFPPHGWRLEPSHCPPPTSCRGDSRVPSSLPRSLDEDP